MSNGLLRYPPGEHVPHREERGQRHRLVLWVIVPVAGLAGCSAVLVVITALDLPPVPPHPWLWSVVHGGAVLWACVGLAAFWWVLERGRQDRDRLSDAHRIAEAEIVARRFTAALLVELGRRDHGMLHRQMEIIGRLQLGERDADVRDELSRLERLTARIRHNAENLVVLVDDEPNRPSSEPVALCEVVRAAIAETPDPGRVRLTVDARPAVSGPAAPDLTRLVAELTENAVRFSAPDTRVTVGCRPLARHPGARLLTIEDVGIGMPDAELAAANALLAGAPGAESPSARRLGLPVVSRLAGRHGIEVTLVAGAGCGVTAAVLLPARLFSDEFLRLATAGRRAEHGGAR